MAYIKTIPYGESNGRLRKLYDSVKGPDDNVDNIMLAHSLRPHTLSGHMALYKNVLHHSGNTIDKWVLEMLGVYVSMLNHCHYCVEHHFSGLARLLDEQSRAEDIRLALENGTRDGPVNKRNWAALDYAEKLTMDAAKLELSDVEILRTHEWDDGEILEINQVCAYFNYANRTVLGLGVTTAGDILGLSPNDSDDEDNWQHR